MTDPTAESTDDPARASYPPEPWALVARMDLSTFLVPRDALPGRTWPAGHRPLVVGGRVPVGAAWVVYEPGGVLAYRELLVSVLLRSRHSPRLAPHVIAIWVDSAASCAGGRELWGIPKGMAELGGDPSRPACTPRGAARPVASAEVVVGRLLPVRVPTTFAVVQDGPLPAGDAGPPPAGAPGGTPLVSPVRTRARMGTASVRWSFDPEGALGFLAGRRPVVSTALRDVAMRFGATPADRARQAS